MIAAQPKLVRQGAACETLGFEKSEGDVCEVSKDRGCATADVSLVEPGQHVLRFGLLVKLGARTYGSDKVSRWLTGSANPETAALRIVHWDERYRVREIPDRIILREEKTGKLLARKRITDDEWEVGFGVSDDVLWRISLLV